MFKLLKKFTNIVVRSLPWLEQFRLGLKLPQVAAFVFPWDADTMYIHKEGRHVKAQYYWETNVVTVLTHEKIHTILRKQKLFAENDGFDKVFSSIPESNFLVDGDWKWLKYRWIWEDEKWTIKKNI